MPDQLLVVTANLRGFAWPDLPTSLVADLDAPIDILMAQEVGNIAADGYHRLLRGERALTAALTDRFGAGAGWMRAFYTPSELGSTGQAVFLRYPRLTAGAHWRAECLSSWHDKAGNVLVHVADCSVSLTVRSLHLPYWSGDARLDTARRLTRYAAETTLFGGDMNSMWPDDPNEPDWSRLPPHRRHHKTYAPHLGGPLLADRRAHTELADAGFTSAASRAVDWTPTVKDGVDCGAEAVIDHILVSPDLTGALLPETYRVHDGPAGSDHRAVSVRLDLDRVTAP